jgi:putative transcriptional regulator
MIEFSPVVKLKYRIKLRALLADKDWNQADLARKTKIRPSTISDLFHEMALSITFENLVKICHALNCTPNDIIEIAPYKRPGRPKKNAESTKTPPAINNKPYTLRKPNAKNDDFNNY